MMAISVGSESPWGVVQSVEQVAHGIWWVSTAGHGGFWLSPSRHACLQRVHRFETFAGGSWYEEDCDAAVVVWGYSMFFDPAASDRAAEQIRSRPGYYGEVYESVVSRDGSAVPVKRKRRSSAKNEAMESLGLVKVRGALGGVYWE